MSGERVDEYKFVKLKDRAKIPLTGHGRKKKPVVFEVGDVKELTNPVLMALAKKWKKSGMGVDLVCGGPPCQGYSIERQQYHRNPMRRHCQFTVKRPERRGVKGGCSDGSLLSSGKVV